MGHFFTNTFSTQKRKWDQWKQDHNFSSNELSSDQVQQQLTLGREPNAQLKVISSSGKSDDSYFWPRGWDSAANEKEYGTNTSSFAQMKKDLKIDSNSQIVYSWNSGESGQLTVEYSGLQNSFYMDENGNKINISKIVATYIPDASDTKHGLIIFSDPTDGFGYLNTTGANVNYKFYNQANQQIDFKNNTAWLAVTSLNSTITNTETAKIINGGKAYGLAGSSIKAHDDGSLYADNHNDGPDGTWDFQAHDGQSWDNKGINEYYGAGLISLQNVSGKKLIPKT